MVALAGAVLAGCGGGRPAPPPPRFAIDVTEARFPRHQTASHAYELRIAVRNRGHRTVPGIAVTLSGEGATAQALAAVLPAEGSGRSQSTSGHAIWLVASAPRGARLAGANTWRLGPLRAGRTRELSFTITPLRPGIHALRYRVAVLPAGSTASGRRSGAVSVQVGGTPVFHF